MHTTDSYTHIHVYIYIYICIDMYSYIHVHIYIYTHAYVYKLSYVHIHSFQITEGLMTHQEIVGCRGHPNPELAERFRASGLALRFRFLGFRV